MDLFDRSEGEHEGTEPIIYNVYHDESKEGDYWHIFYFVPVTSRSELLQALKEALLNSRYKGKDRSFKEIRASPTGNNMIEYWLSVLHASFQMKIGDGMLPFTIGRPVGGDYYNKKIFRQFSKPLQCRIAIFYLPNGHNDLTLIDDPTRRIECTFRMGLQGACHYLFSAESPVIIQSIFIDRECHYRRRLDRKWIFRKLSERFRDYCSLGPDCQIEGEIVHEDDRIIIDSTDIFLGTIRYAYLTPHERNHSKKAVHAQRIESILDLIARGSKRMQNSRLGKFAAFSKAWLENGEWQYIPLAQDHFRRKESGQSELSGLTAAGIRILESSSQ